MKKTYDRKFFRQKLLSEKKTVTAVSRLLIILLLGFPLLTRAGTSGSSRGEIDLLSGTSTRQDSVVAAGKPENQKLGFYEGEVMDTEGNPLPGVTVLLKGTQTGTSTDTHGAFRFPATKAGKTMLVFSFIGMKPVEKDVTPGKKVIVVGSGPVGLSFVKLGKLFGLGQIDIVDMLPAKLEVARRMGADNGYTPAEISTPEFIAAAGRSYDAVIDAVGLDVVVNSVLPLVKMGGDVCVYGVMTKNPTFDLSKAPYNFDLHMHQWPTRSEEKAAMTTLAQWIEEGTLSASDFITHRFKIEEIEEAFAAVKRGEVLKCVLTF